MTRSSPLTIVAITTAAPGKERELRAAQEQLVAETVLETGCLRFELNQSLEEGRILLFVESWASEDARRAHMHGGPVQRFQESGAGNVIQEFGLYGLAMVVNGKAARSVPESQPRSAA